MKTVFRVLSYVFVAIGTAVTVLALCLLFQKQDKLDELQTVIDRYFIEEADKDQLQDAAASAMIEALGDEWSYYMTAEEYQQYQEVMSNSYVGVGITIQVREDNQGFDIVEVVPGGPAEEAGVKAGDVLIAADGQSLKGISIDDTRPLIRGEEGTRVELTVVRKSMMLLVYVDSELSLVEAQALGAKINALENVMGAEFISGEEAWEGFVGAHEDEDAFVGIDQDVLRHAYHVTLKDGAAGEETAQLLRQISGIDEVKVLSLDEKELSFAVTRRQFETPVATYEMLEGNIGLVTIENFDQRCAQETIAAIEALREQGATALIFDVRNNPGGYKDELVKVLDYLLPEGDLFRSVDYQGNEEVDTSDADHLDMPMAVLMNLQSYSAAEFFAAALSEYDAAVTVGEKTYGKGYFQTAIVLSDGSAVNLSIGKYYTPKGESLVGKGLTPDVEVVVDEETAAKIYYGTLEAEEDPQILAAINALKNGK